MSKPKLEVSVEVVAQRYLSLRVKRNGIVLSGTMIEVDMPEFVSAMKELGWTPPGESNGSGKKD